MTKNENKLKKKMKKENGFQRFLSETDLLYNNRSFQRDNIQFYFLGFKVKRTTTLQLWPSYSNSIIAAIPSFLEEKNSSSSVFFTGENLKDQLDSIRHFEEFQQQHQRKSAFGTIHHSFSCPVTNETRSKLTNSRWSSWHLVMVKLLFLSLYEK